MQIANWRWGVNYHAQYLTKVYHPIIMVLWTCNRCLPQHSCATHGITKRQHIAATADNLQVFGLPFIQFTPPIPKKAWLLPILSPQNPKEPYLNRDFSDMSV